MGFDQRPFSPDRLLEYTRVAQGLGFRAIAANDHLVFARPWLDGLTALAAGGGGYGEPERRDAAARDWDLKNGHVAGLGDE